MTEIRFGGRCEKHLCPKPCTKCAEAGDSSTITVPRETWDAMISALENHPGNYKLTTLESRVYQTIITRAEALTATNAVSHPKTEAAPAPEGGAITSESAAAFYEQAFGVKLTDSAQIGGVLRLCNLAANAVTSECSKVTSEYSEQPQVQGEAYSERFYGSGEDRGWWIVRGGLVKREHVAFLGESVSPEEVSKVVAELNAAHPQATEPAWRPIETAPKDGTRILVCKAKDVDGNPMGDSFGLFVQRAEWWEGDGWIVYCSLVHEPQCFFDPTHWMPLPAAPEAK